MLGSWITDAHYAARRLRAGPGYALLAVLTLALGVGGTASAYGVARGVLFDPLPYTNERDVGVALLSLLTALALTLGAVGIYGVIAHFAMRRRRDWAIRVALGLPGSRVVAHVVGHGALLVTVGIGIGVLAAAALARLLSSLLGARG